MTLDELRLFAVARAFREPADLLSAIRRLGYLQADPIRAPARAQDLILRHRVAGYRVDDLENKYPRLPIIEDVLHNYGFFPEEHRALLYPRASSIYGAGRTASRHIRHQPNAGSGTTRCRCCGATTSSAGPTCPWSKAS